MNIWGRSCPPSRHRSRLKSLKPGATCRRRVEWPGPKSLMLPNPIEAPAWIGHRARVGKPVDAVGGLHVPECRPVALRQSDICAGEHGVIRSGLAEHAEFEVTVGQRAAQTQHVKRHCDV